MIFTRTDWDRLARLFNGRGNGEDDMYGTGPAYSGYKPSTVEAPNGDTRCPECDMTGQCKMQCSRRGTGRVPNVDAGGTCECCGGSGRLDAPVWPGDFATPCKACNGTGRVSGKRYLHVADKYPDAPDWARAYHDRAYAHACRVATALGVPAAYYPRPETGALRVLEYPAGAGSVEHTDFDLFTVVLWRETPADLELHPSHIPARHVPLQYSARESAARALSPGLHIGELGELVGLGPATPHRVPARPYVQRSIVYFALPDHAAELPGPYMSSIGASGHPVEGRYTRGPTVGAWLAERMARSRYDAR